MRTQGVEMPLKIKGDQIKHSSIALENLEDIDSGKILGRGSNDGTGTTSLISSQDIRLSLIHI